MWSTVVIHFVFCLYIYIRQCQFNKIYFLYLGTHRLSNSYLKVLGSVQ